METFHIEKYLYLIYSVFNTATINEITTSILRIKTVEPQQFGDYVCKANNKVGSASERLNVFGN